MHSPGSDTAAMVYRNYKNGLAALMVRFHERLLAASLSPYFVLVKETTPAKLSVRQIRDVYSRLAPFYGFWEKLTESRAKEVAFELSAVRDGERILEVAVGRGTMLKRLALANPHGFTVGADLTAAMLERTRRRLRQNPRVRAGLCQCNACALPFAARSFDCVFSSYLLDLQSAADIEKTLREWYRVLRPAGKLVILHLSAGNLWFDRIWRIAYGIMPTLLGGCRPLRLAAHLPAIGFSVLENRRITQSGIPSEVILARRNHGAK